MPDGRIGKSRFRVVRSRSHGRLLSEARDAATADEPEKILIVPSVAAGERFAHSLPGGTLGLHRLSLVAWAALLSRQYLAKDNLSPVGGLGLEAVVARALHRAISAKELTYFHPVETLPGFAKALARTIQELRLAGVQPTALAKTGAPGADLAKLLVRYQTELEEVRLADLAKIFEFAREAVAAKDAPLVGLPIIALDVPLETAAHQTFFRAVAEKSPAVFVTAIADLPGKTDKDIFEKLLGVASENLDSEPERGTLARLRRRLFDQGSFSIKEVKEADSAFEIFSAPGESMEAVEIARRMMKLARDGKPFDQMAVLLRSVDRYQPLVEEALRRASIPAYFSRGTLRPDPAGRAFLALLECANEKLSASRFAEYLSLSQVPSRDSTREQEVWIAPQDELLGLSTNDAAPQTERAIEADDHATPWAPARWESLLVDAAVIGGKDRWERRLKGLEREFELRIATAQREDENQHAALERQLGQLRQLQEFALPVIEQLAALPASATWGTWIEALSSLARKTLRRPEGVLGVLAELEPMADVGPLALEEISGVLSERMRFLRTEPPSRGYGCVFVGSVDEARGREFAVVFLPGLSEGLFPQRSLEDPLLLDQYRRALTESLPTRDRRVEREREKLQLAVGAARDRLIASYPRIDTAEGRPRVPSFYALELPRAIDGHLPKLKQFEEEARACASASVNWPAPRDTQDAIDDAEFDLAKLHPEVKEKAAKYLIEVSPILARSLRARWKRWNQKWWDADGLITTSDEALAALAKHRLTARAWSPSTLQKFAECPYAFALHGIFGLKPREKSEALEQLDPLTRGGLFHAIQFELLGTLKDAELLPVTPQNLEKSLDILNAALGRTAAAYKEDLAPAIERVWQTSIEDLRTDLRGWLQAVAANDAGWAPLHFEFAFGLPASSGRDSASTSSQAILEEGVHLRGSIDLVEREVSTGSLRVTDHKTGKRPEAIPLYVGGGKLLQPLLYGLTAQKLLGKDVTAGRLFYATQRGSYEPIEIKINERSRGVLAKLLANIDASIANGFLPPAPQKDTCEHCDYRTVCGPYEEQRCEETKNRRDERLDALIEIRGMG